MSFWILSTLDRSSVRCILNGYRSICNIKFMTQDDPDHSEDEDRCVLLGLSSSLRLLLVCHSYREEGHTVRIISARNATSGESNYCLQRCHMRKEYDFSAARKNPYAAQLKKQITIRLDEESITYFKSIFEDVGIPYQSLINLYLRDCAASHRKLNLDWK